MNIIIQIINGFADTPLLIKDDEKARAVFRDIAERLLGDDADEVLGLFDDDGIYDRVNNYLSTNGIEILFFTDIQPQ
jgi:hypothetical protein